MTKKKDTSPELTQKQKKFVEEFQKNGGNMTQAALVAYNTTSYNTAANIGFDNMRKPKITQYLQALGVKGRTFLEKVLDGEKIDGEKPNIKTRVDIAKFFDDKEFGKAVQHTDVTSNGEKVSFSVINFGDKIE